jgi:2-methylcitrate dehydratase
MANTPLIKQLAHWVDSFDPADVPADVKAQAGLLVLDSLGCALAALDEDTARATRRAVDGLGGKEECTIIGSSHKTAVTNAVLMNGLLIRTLDLNDFLQGANGAGHPSDNIAVALSMTERQKRSGCDMLSAIILGYELYGRIRELATQESTWDHVTASGLVAPAVAGRLLGLDEEKLANALAFGAAHCHALRAVRGGQLSAAKSLANAIVAQTATLGALLAAEGLTGPMKVLEGSYGLGEAVFPDADLNTLIAPLDGHFRIMDVSIKAYPCIGTAQTAVAAAIQARQDIKNPLAEIERIEVHMADTPFVSGQVNNPERRQPASRETADHSFNFLVAVALLDGELTPRQFHGQRWLDPSVRNLMERITVQTDPSLNVYIPDSFPAVIKIIMRDQTNHTTEVPYAPGHPRNRLTAGGVAAKFHSCAQDALPEVLRKAVVSEVENLDALPNLDRLMHLLANPVSGRN